MEDRYDVDEYCRDVLLHTTGGHKHGEKSAVGKTETIDWCNGI